MQEKGNSRLTFREPSAQLAFSLRIRDCTVFDETRRQRHRQQLVALGNGTSSEETAPSLPFAQTQDG